MKEEFKTEELRQTATEIKEAVRSKSVTADMVGGTLLALVNATGEVLDTLGHIPREHVKVQVRAKDWGEPQMENPDGVVIVDMFASPGFPGLGNIHQEIPIGEGGVVEFDVPYGYQYTVYSKVEGLGASFQYPYTAQKETRMIDLYNVPIGIWLGVVGSWCNDETGYEDYYCLVICREADWDWAEFGSYRMQEGDYFDEHLGGFVLISTTETSFAITTDNASTDRIRWCSSRFYGDGIPTLPMLGVNHRDVQLGLLTEEEYTEQWETFRKQAMQDFNGALNTAKILASDHGDSAALWCLNSTANYNETRFLPSAGQLLLIQQNAKAINDIMMELGTEADCFPYYDSVQKKWVGPGGQWTNQCWWSSTQSFEFCSWVVGCYGGVYVRTRHYAYDVRAVSAFHFEY